MMGRFRREVDTEAGLLSQWDCSPNLYLVEGCGNIIRILPYHPPDSTVLPNHLTSAVNDSFDRQFVSPYLPRKATESKSSMAFDIAKKEHGSTST